MRKWINYIIILTLVFSCKNNRIPRPEKPDNLISKSNMVEVLYDMTLLSAAKGVNKKVMENKGIRPQEYVFKKHNIDSLQFVLSNEYYAYDLDTYEELYGLVKAKLDKDKRHFNNLIDAEKKEKDSIVKARRRSRDSALKNSKTPGLLKRRDSFPQ